MMLRPLFVAGALATALATVPASAQLPQSPPAQTDTKVVGLPVYSSDGHKLGEVTEVGVSGGERALRAEMGDFLGLGSRLVMIGASAFQQQADRIVVSMTAEEVKNRLTKQ